MPLSLRIAASRYPFIVSLLIAFTEDGVLANTFTVVGLRTVNYRNEDRHASVRSIQIEPPINDTSRLIQAAMQLTEAAFRPGQQYIKAKVAAKSLVLPDEVQGDLFSGRSHDPKRERLMNALDRINKTHTPRCDQVRRTGAKA